MPDLDTTFAAWHAELWRRHSQNLTFPEIRRGLQALSDWYVHKRAQL